MDCLFALEDVTNVPATRKPDGTRPPTGAQTRRPSGKENYRARAGRVHPWYNVPEFVRRAVERAADEVGDEIVHSTRAAMESLCRCELCLDKLTTAFVPLSDDATHGHLSAVCDRCATDVMDAAKGERVACPLCIKSRRRPVHELPAPYFRFCDQRTLVALVVARCLR